MRGAKTSWWVVETLTCAFKPAKISSACIAGWDPGSSCCRGDKNHAFSGSFFKNYRNTFYMSKKACHTCQALPCFDGLTPFNYNSHSKDSVDTFAKQILCTEESYTCVDYNNILYTNLCDSCIFHVIFFRLIFLLRLIYVVCFNNAEWQKYCHKSPIM